MGARRYQPDRTSTRRPRPTSAPVGVGRAVVGQPLTFVAWCALLFGVSALSHYGFEKPLQQRIRALGGVVPARPSPTVS